MSASFGFARFACPPEEITRELGVEPDLTVTKGSARRILDGRKTVIAPFSTWSISSSCDSKDVNEHLRELFGRLGSAKRSFDPAWGEPAFGVTWKGNYLYAGSGPFYERDVIERIAALGASVYQDIYSSCDFTVFPFRTWGNARNWARAGTEWATRTRCGRCS